MAGRREAEDDSVIAARVVAVLLSLACLVESLILYPRPVRRLVLWLMRPAEKAVRNFVLQQAFARNVRALPQAIFAPPCCTGAAEARRMALCFRAMARVLAQFVSPGGYSADWLDERAGNFSGLVGKRGWLRRLSILAEQWNRLFPTAIDPTLRRVEAIGQKWNSS